MEDELDMQVIICSGMDNHHRAIFGFMTALAGLASGQRVSVVLTMNGAYWASPLVGNEPSIPGYPSVAEVLSLTGSDNPEE